jgi:FkbH-like protein
VLTEQSPTRESTRKIKCVVWDLDNTLWHGVLLEKEKITLREGITGIIQSLDRRGILQSIASRNDHTKAMEKLRQFGITDYFLYPQINWNAKSSSIEAIAESININIDTIAFVDDQSFERAEVSFHHPGVLCIDAADIDRLPLMAEMNPRFITDETGKRRLLYLHDMERKKAEEDFRGPKEEFLATLEMKLTIAPADQDDLKRAEELTLRTNQLNTTGYTYSYEELDHFRQSGTHLLLIADLQDTYGAYGKIGLCLVEALSTVWTIKLLLMSCRVIARGIGNPLINAIRNEARARGVTLRAEFMPTDVNRMMYMTYKLAHFREKERSGSLIILENDLEKLQEYPAYLTVNTRL